MPHKDFEKLKEYKKKYYQKNKEKLKKYFKEKRKTEIYKKYFKKYYQEYVQKNAGKLKSSRKKYRKENKEKLKIVNKNWRLKNKKYIKNYKNKNKDKNLEYGKIYRWKNIKEIKKQKKIHRSKRKTKIQRNKYQKERRKIPKNHLDTNFSNHIRIAMNNKKAYRTWESLVGYTLQDLFNHLEKQFDKKMNWENYGSYWHIDHIVPISWFPYETAEEQAFKDCWGLKNLQPLEAKMNMSKGNRLIF